MKNQIESHIRSFGMSGFLIGDELKQIESAYSLELGHIDDNPAEGGRQYFPQFEQSVRVEASEMANHYETFYCLEKSIRKVISETLAEADSATWWEGDRVPQCITQEVAKRIKKEVDSGVTRRSDDPIDYSTFGELSQIITSNWDVFGAIFTSPRAVERVMAQLNLLRGPIAHCSPITEDEIDRLNLSVKDWFRIMA